MEPLSHLDSFIFSAEGGSFSVAARRLGLTPAAVSKNVARLEASLGVRLFQRSTRSLTLTEAGERFLRQAEAPFAELQAAVADVSREGGRPSGTLKVSMALAFGRHHIVPLLGEFLARYPDVVPDWHFDNRQVDLIAEGFDAAIGGGIELTPGVIARELSPIAVLVVASPAYMAGRAMPEHPSDLAHLDGIARRSRSSGRLRSWTLRHRNGEEAEADFRPVAIFDDPEAMADAAALGLGVSLIPAPHAAPYIASGRLLRLLPEWCGEAGPLSIYYSSKKLLPAKTRVFVDFVVEQFRLADFARRIGHP
ncbi:LysR family transcriptional regulator [Massilia endophytica]|uniref:LysR family transcriptional regulator n=1 Tax=Massilia endophytica TaxID=2899220 RepID=UPI001E4DEC91|nr:LysR family transcriptional regulator [Massilia endophytica]UGQ47735.1 LysR family transcriptional regulator [Massilia endophytica]